EVASALGVPTVVLMSGLPGAHGDSSPNWVTTSWPPENLEILDYQWNEVAIPYWKELAGFAREKGVKLAVEACGGQLVYSTSTMLRLIEATGGDVVGANLDPSHLMWMGADIPTVIRTLGEAIFHVHAKDIRVNDWISARDGLLDTVAITAARRSGPTSSTASGPRATTARSTSSTRTRWSTPWREYAGRRICSSKSLSSNHRTGRQQTYDLRERRHSASAVSQPEHLALLHRVARQRI